MSRRLCQRCHYFSATRYGNLCSFDGSYEPDRTECPNFIDEESVLARSLLMICPICNERLGLIDSDHPLWLAFTCRKCALIILKMRRGGFGAEESSLERV